MEEERQKRGCDITESKRQSKLNKDDSWSEVVVEQTTPSISPHV